MNFPAKKKSSAMRSDNNSYQIKAVCKQCNKIISRRVDRIKTHLLKCGRGKDLGEYEEIGSLVRYWGNAKKKK